MDGRLNTTEIHEEKDINDEKDWAKYAVRMAKFLVNIYKRDLMQKQRRYERLTDTFDGRSPKNSQRKIPVHTRSYGELSAATWN